jgi:UDP-N-acetylglucosamine 2-epimerase
MKILCVFGTRPEAIKMAPVVRALRETPGVTCRVCVTGQHREMLDQALELFRIHPDHDLNVMAHARGLSQLTSAILAGLDAVLEEERPDRVLVHGDTATTLAGAMTAYYHRIPVGHVEAGLRTGDLYAPWPEEGNRQITGRLADQHYAPTLGARANLLAEGTPENRIHITGNTVIDALQWVRGNVLSQPAVEAGVGARFPFLDPSRRMILLTGHRRENHDGGLSRVLRAVRDLSETYELDVVYPVHLNPIVQAAARETLGSTPGVHLIEPCDYLGLLWLMQRAYLVITDSGGIQEEAPSLSKPVLVTRDKTERPEAVDAGVVRLVGTSEARISLEARRLLDNPAAYRAMARRQNPYGDGRAAGRIAAIASGRAIPEDGFAPVAARSFA